MATWLLLQLIALLSMMLEEISFLPGVFLNFHDLSRT